MKITLCSVNDPEAALIKGTNEQAGYGVYVDPRNNTYWTEIIISDLVWRSASAVFDRVEDGTYIIRRKG